MVIDHPQNDERMMIESMKQERIVGTKCATNEISPTGEMSRSDRGASLVRGNVRNADKRVAVLAQRMPSPAEERPCGSAYASKMSGKIFLTSPSMIFQRARISLSSSTGGLIA